MISLPWIAMLTGATLAFAGIGREVTTETGPAQRAASRQETTALELRIPVKGLDERNGPLVERTLRELVDESDPPEALLREVHVDEEATSLQLTVAPGKTLRLSQVERALTTIRGEVQRQRLQIADARLVVEGRSEEDLGERIREALTAARLFEELEVRSVADAPRYLLTVRGGNEKASAAAVAKALQEVSPALELGDVLWTAPEPEDESPRG